MTSPRLGLSPNPPPLPPPDEDARSLRRSLRATQDAVGLTYRRLVTWAGELARGEIQFLRTPTAKTSRDVAAHAGEIVRVVTESAPVTVSFPPATPETGGQEIGVAVDGSAVVTLRAPARVSLPGRGQLTTTVAGQASIVAQRWQVLESDGAGDWRLLGAQGPQGTQGPQGDTITGPQGVPGESITGPQGVPGESITGPQGVPGESITGPQGETGAQGPQGPLEFYPVFWWEFDDEHVGVIRADAGVVQSLASAAWTAYNMTVGGDSSGYTLTSTVATGEHYVAATITGVGPGYFEVTADAYDGAQDFIVLSIRGGATIDVWFDLASGTVGTQTATSGVIVAAGIGDLGSGVYRCTLRVDCAGTVLRVYSASTDGSLSSVASSPSTAITVSNVTVTQKRAIRADNRGAMHGTVLQQSTAALQPVFCAISGDTANGNGLMFAGDTTSGSRYLSLTDLTGTNDIHAMFDVGCEPFAVWIVATRNAVDAHKKPLICIANAAANQYAALYLESTNVLLGKKDSSMGSIVTATHSSAAGLQLYTGYYDGTGLIVGCAATYSSATAYTSTDDSTCATIEVGGASIGIDGDAAHQSGANIFAVYLAPGRVVAPGDALDVSLRARIAAEFGITT